MQVMLFVIGCIPDVPTMQQTRQEIVQGDGATRLH